MLIKRKKKKFEAEINKRVEEEVEDTIRVNRSIIKRYRKENERLKGQNIDLTATVDAQYNLILKLNKEIEDLKIEKKEILSRIPDALPFEKAKSYNVGQLKSLTQLIASKERFEEALKKCQEGMMVRAHYVQRGGETDG